MKIIEVKNLETSFKTKKKDLVAVRNMNFSIDKGEALGIVGESGSGKSVSVKSILRILPKNGHVSKGEIIFDNKNILELSDEEFRKIQGNEISIIFQDPMTALNPLKTIGFHIDEVLIRHMNMSKSDARKRTIELLKLVEIPNPIQRVNQYPHQFSGGMRQRVMIALSLACNPKLLIADEPTTALDVTIQSQILRLLKKLQKEQDMTIILITHDLAVVYSMCKNIIVMYGGLIMEKGSREEVFKDPKHPYTKALLNSIPDMDSDKELIPIDGVAPSLESMPKGCPFAPRCSIASSRCFEELPEESKITASHSAFCFEVGGSNE